ncbi:MULTISPECIES: phosphoglycerate kinase [unclassified Roseitalea]|uniref:phosphoglycerate kinase n=1 Tax=unclassified Roseitalea TaxID=2639107 RepID=UPI00273E4CA1|nr:MULTISPECIES: phosphoglycerate kinase [unclassified Roseitalea]
MPIRTLDDLTDISGKRVMVRVDLNVPMADGQVSDATRLERAAPTITELSRRGAKVILLSHFGRPKGKVVPDMSLRPVAQALEEVLDLRVDFAADCIGSACAARLSEMAPGDIVLFENTRFHPGEEANDADFARALAENGDIYVNDAFSAAHRAHASTEAIARHLPAYAGRAMQAELEALQKGLGDPARPLVAIVGGAKVSTKIDLLENLIAKVDALVIGGGMANTFLAARGVDVGRSLCEHDLAETARTIIARAAERGCAIVLPIDVVVAAALEEGAATRTVDVDAVPADRMILDIGPASVAKVNGWIGQAATLVWNGPLGAFEVPPFDAATMAAARHAANLTAKGDLVSIAGGGDTVAALNKAGVTGKFTYVSAAGGAFLEWMEGRRLPGVAALQA